MEPAGCTPQEGTFMVILTAEEVKEMRLAMAMRARMNGSGTRAHIVCTEILKKIDESESHPHVNGNTPTKAYGVDSARFKEF